MLFRSGDGDEDEEADDSCDSKVSWGRGRAGRSNEIHAPIRVATPIATGYNGEDLSNAAWIA